MYTSEEYGGVSSGAIPHSGLKSREKREFQPEIPAAPLALHKTRSDEAVDLLTKQMIVSVAYFCTIFILSLVPSTSGLASRLYEVQHTHFLDGRDVYEAGPEDFGIVLTSGMAVVGLRALFVRVFLSVAPLLEIHSSKKAVRFAEQSWCVVYYTALTSIGLYLLRQSEYSWNPQVLWQDYPHIYISAGVKAYYLFQLGFWITQIYIIHAEEPRKDHYQMLAHHIITCMLVIGSYLNYYTRIGHLIMIIMDGVDLQLCVAKCLKYTGFSRLCDFAFMLFLIGWVVNRHIVYMYQLYYAYFVATDSISTNCKFHAGSGQTICFNQKAHDTFGFLLLCLQVITLIWLWMILKVVIRVIRGDGAADTRSDDESD